MKEVRLSSWNDLEAAVSSLFQDIDDKRTRSETYVSYPLFRGHASASWTLSTTLERYSGKIWSANDYYEILCAVKPTIESLTSQSWSLSETCDRDDSEIRAPLAPLGYELMVYLRHHGFPSPLLDWTRSPYVAAFFAYCSNETNEDSEVAIYSYVEYYGAGKGGIGSKPRIVGLGPYVVAHRRHYSQQSEYTICEKHEAQQYVYWNHEDVFAGGESEEDLITKFVLPRNERINVMRKLEIMNITSYALFGNEESLMETLAYREIQGRGK